MLDSVTDDIFMAPYGEPLLLTGRPTELTGRVDLHNPAGTNLVIREADLRDPNRVLPGKLFRQVLAPIVLRPTQRQSVTLTIALDPTTPPGEYRVELDLAGRSHPVVLQVAEVFALKIQPSSFVVANLLNQVQEKRLIVTNQGNVPEHRRHR